MNYGLPKDEWESDEGTDEWLRNPDFNKETPHTETLVKWKGQFLIYCLEQSWDPPSEYEWRKRLHVFIGQVQRGEINLEKSKSLFGKALTATFGNKSLERRKP